MKALYKYYVRYYRTHNDLRTVTIEAISKEAALEALREKDKVLSVECCVKMRHTGTCWIVAE